MAVEKAISLLGFCARARKVQFGTNTALTLMEHGKAKLVIVATDMSENTKERVFQAAKSFGVPALEYGLSDELSHITGNSGRGIFVITDKQFAESIAQAIRDTRHN